MKTTNVGAIKCAIAVQKQCRRHTSTGSSRRSMHSAVRILTMSPTWFLSRRRCHGRVRGTRSTTMHWRPSRLYGTRCPMWWRRRSLYTSLQWQATTFQLYTSNNNKYIAKTTPIIHSPFIQGSIKNRQTTATRVETITRIEEIVNINKTVIVARLRDKKFCLWGLMCDQKVGSCGFVHADCTACCWHSRGRSRCNRCWVLPTICAKSLLSASSQILAKFAELLAW